MKYRPKEEIQKYIDLHLKGWSCARIAKKFGRKKNSVLHNLRDHGVLRKNTGYQIEQEVAQWFEKQGKQVIKQCGDAPFDMLVNGQKVDVKSSNYIYDKSNNASYYKFQITDYTERRNEKDIQAEIDWFCLVFLDGVTKKIYRLNTTDVFVKSLINIHNVESTKYPLLYLGEI